MPYGKPLDRTPAKKYKFELRLLLTIVLLGVVFASMNKESVDQLGSLQRAVMEIVWDSGEATVHQVVGQFRRRKKPAYTTILTVLRKLEKGGWLRHRAEGRVYVYAPTCTREELGARSIRRTVQQLFRGDLRACMQYLIDGHDLSQDDLRELRRMIDQRRRQDRNG